VPAHILNVEAQIVLLHEAPDYIGAHWDHDYIGAHWDLGFVKAHLLHHKTYLSFASFNAPYNLVRLMYENEQLAFNHWYSAL